MDTVTNTYAHRHRIALSLRQPTGAWTNGFAYDAAGRLTNVTSQAGSFGYEYSSGVASSAFDSTLVKRLVLPSLAAITNDFDGVARLLATHFRTSTGVLTNKHEYLYNLAGQRTRETRYDSSTRSFSYDPIGQLTVVRATNSTGTLISGETKGYLYDSAWNLNQRTNNSTKRHSGQNKVFTISFDVSLPSNILPLTPMARKLRIQYRVAIYHVMSGGDRREAIFTDDHDRQLFLSTHDEASERTARGVATCRRKAGTKCQSSFKTSLSQMVKVSDDRDSCSVQLRILLV